MFDELLTASLEIGKQELAEITALANENGHSGELKHWDVAFWSERLREQRYSFTDEELATLLFARTRAGRSVLTLQPIVWHHGEAGRR